MHPPAVVKLPQAPVRVSRAPSNSGQMNLPAVTAHLLTIACLITPNLKSKWHQEISDLSWNRRVDCFNIRRGCLSGAFERAYSTCPG